MAYVTPPRPTVGTTIPTAADLNKYSDALNALNGLLGSARNFAVPENFTTNAIFIWHKWRWLHYLTASGETATISDPGGVGANVTLSDSGAAPAAYDMSNVSWLTEGSLYSVDGADMAAEDFEA